MDLDINTAAALINAIAHSPFMPDELFSLSENDFVFRLQAGGVRFTITRRGRSLSMNQPIHYLIVNTSGVNRNTQVWLQNVPLGNVQAGRATLVAALQQLLGPGGNLIR